MVTKSTTKTAEKEVKHHPPKAGHFEGRFKQGRGGRKTATAQVRLYPKNTGIMVNGKEYTKYFPQLRHQMMITAPLTLTELLSVIGVSAHVNGGGINGQAEAIRHGIARALLTHDITLRKQLKREGFLTRDPRAVERKKYGLKKARRAPQWAKR
jgi:small subunit ribosomal protein S9